MIYSDRHILTLLLLIALVVMGGVWYFSDDAEQTRTTERQAAPAPASRWQTKHYAVKQRSVETFVFDPNTADSTQLLRLGLQPWQVRNIYKYRAHGGVYRKKEDFARLYGLTVKDYRRLAPYIRIGADYQAAATLVARGGNVHRDSLQHRDSSLWVKKISATQHVVLNGATEEMLRTVPGIGVFYAHEIVRHGQWLGGYVDVDQLDEIDNFPKETKKYFVIKHPNPVKLKVNELSLAALRRHPYINFYQAKAIVDYRRLRGKLRSLRDLRLLDVFTEADFQRLEPYVEY